MTSLKTNYLLKVPSPNAITLKVSASAYEFGGDTNIQSITDLKCFFLYERTQHNDTGIDEIDERYSF